MNFVGIDLRDAPSARSMLTQACARHPVVVRVRGMSEPQMWACSGLATPPKRKGFAIF